MHVAMVSEHANPLARLGEVDAGGQNVYVAALSRELARRGHRVTVFTRRDDACTPTMVDLCPGVSVVHLDAGPATHIDKDHLFDLMPAFTDELERMLRIDPPDLLHAHFWMSGWAALRARSRLGLPVVQTFHAIGAVKQRHQGGADTSPAIRHDVEQMIARNADRVIATCSEEADELRRLGVPGANLARVPCGYDDDVFTAFGPAAVRHPGQRRLVAVSRLVPRKGLDDLIAAMAHLGDVELAIAGGPPRARLCSDPDFQRLSTMCDRHGVTDRVWFAGGLDQVEVARLLRSADLFVAAPWYEPFGIAPVEAMACGIPVVGTAVGGLLDTVLDGQTGILVEPRSPQRLAEAIGGLLADDRTRRAMGALGARRTSRTYGWRVVGASMERLYREAVSSATVVELPG